MNRRAARRLAARLPVVQIVLLVALFAYGAISISGYGSANSVRPMLVFASFLGIAAAGQTLVVLLGGIDLSIPFVIGAANVIVAELTGGHHWSLAAAVVVILVMAAGVGALNGWLSQSLQIHPLIVTLGTGSMVAGGVLVWTKAQVTGSVPAVLANFVSPARSVGPLPVAPVVLLWAATAVAVTIVLVRSRSGRRLYATGAGPRAAGLALVRTGRLWTGTFAFSAVAAAVTGILLAGFSGTGLFEIGQPYLFTSIAAVVVGGTSLLGARGDYARTVIGTLILIQATTIMAGKGLSAPAQQMVLGGLILAFVASYGREPRVGSRI